MKKYIKPAVETISLDAEVYLVQAISSSKDEYIMINEEEVDFFQ